MNASALEIFAAAVFVPFAFVMAWVALFAALGVSLWLGVQIVRLAGEKVKRRLSFYEELRRRGYYK